MNVDIAQKVVTPATQPGASGAEKVGDAHGDKNAAFRQHIGNDANNAQALSTNGTNALDPTKAAQKVTGAQIPDKQDLFGRFDQVRKELDNFMQRSSELDKLVADGKLKANDPKVVQHHREEMRMMLHFQSEMQGAAMKVEIASKVVEHGTSGMKTVLSTQA